MRDEVALQGHERVSMAAPAYKVHARCVPGAYTLRTQCMPSVAKAFHNALQRALQRALNVQLVHYSVGPLKSRVEYPPRKSDAEVHLNFSTGATLPCMAHTLRLHAVPARTQLLWLPGPEKAACVTTFHLLRMTLLFLTLLLWTSVAAGPRKRPSSQLQDAWLESPERRMRHPWASFDLADLRGPICLDGSDVLPLRANRGDSGADSTPLASPTDDAAPPPDSHCVLAHSGASTSPRADRDNTPVVARIDADAPLLASTHGLAQAQRADHQCSADSTAAPARPQNCADETAPDSSRRRRF